MKIACRSVRKSPGRWPRALAWITGFLALLVTPAVLGGGFRDITLVAIWGVLATIAGLVISSTRMRRNVAIDVAPDAIEDGYEAHAKLVLHLANGGRIEAEPEGRDPAAVLEELGLTLDRRALSAPLRGTLGSFTRGLLAYIFAMFVTIVLSIPLKSPFVTAFVPLLVGAIAATIVPRIFRPRVIVGLDGLRVVGVLRPKFVPYAKIQSAGRVLHAEMASIVLETADGPLRLPVIGQSNEQVDALIARIERGRKRYGELSARSLDALDRAGRTIAEWTEAVRRLPNAGTFRQAALGVEDLEKVVADPKAPLERRVGAALALDDAAKIRVAAEQAADPKVRVALEATIAEDEDAIERALKR